MVKPRQLIQHLSAFLFLSTIFSGKQPLLYRLRETKLPPSPWFCASTDDQRPLKTPAVQRVPRVVLMVDVIVQGVYKVAIFNGIVLIQVACSSLPCTLSLYNAFMWTVSVKAGQSELNGTRTDERTKELRKDVPSRDLLKFIYRSVRHMNLVVA